MDGNTVGQQQDAFKGFLNLRESILKDIEPLVADNQLPALDRFDVCMRLARAHGGLGYYEKAHELLKEIEGEDKLNLYLGLLSDIDFEINNATNDPDNAGAQAEVVGPDAQYSESNVVQGEAQTPPAS